MHIRKLDPKNKQDVKTFVQFPFALYRDCPQWVPPLVSSAMNALNPKKHPFYLHSEADFFLAESNGSVVGRIAAVNNRLFNQHTGANTAFFGFFEVIEDIAVSHALFDTVFTWARERGFKRIVGPKALIGAEGGGILVEGHEHRPALNIPYNFAYYNAFIKAAGFEKDYDHLSGYLPGDYDLPQRLLEISEKVKKRRGYWIKSFESKDEMRAWIPKVQKVHSQAFSRGMYFYPPTDEETRATADMIMSVAHPSLIKLVMKDEDVIGFIFSYHDVSAGLQKSRGRLFPLGWIHILLDRKRTEWVNVNGVGLLPEYQGLGANTILYTEVAKSIRAFEFKHADIVQIREDNFASRSDMENMGVQWYKRHRSYHRDL